MAKATCAADVRRFEDIPNVGVRMTDDFRLLGLKHPVDLKKQQALSMYQTLCRRTGVRQDPCVLDVFMAAIDFMNGAKPKPWWRYTAVRKKKFPMLTTDR
jgi:hypothetical protein